MKRFLSVFVSMLICFGMICPFAHAEDEDVDPVSDVAVYVVVSDGNVSLDGGSYGEAVSEFLDDLAVTSNFVVYADTYNPHCHIDGNIAVNELGSALESLKPNANITAEEDRYSYIGSGNGNSIGTVDDAIIITAETVKVLSPQNAVIDGSSSEIGLIINNINSGNGVPNISGTDYIISLEDVLPNEDGSSTVTGVTIDGQRVEKEIQIDNNLSELATVGQKLSDIAAEQNNLKNYQAVEAVNSFLQTGSITQDAVITLTVDAKELEYSSGRDQQWMQKEIEKMVSLNKPVKATIIISVDTQGVGSAGVQISHPINGNAFAEETGYLVWNFGSYGGSITAYKSFVGVIVAPNATVNSNVIHGRVVAKTLNQGSGQEIHQPDNSRQELPSTPQESPPVVSPSATSDVYPSPAPTNSPAPSSSPAPSTAPVTVTDYPSPPAPPVEPSYYNYYVPTEVNDSGLVDIDDEDVPLANVPGTGELLPWFLMGTIFTGFGLVCVYISGFKLTKKGKRYK